MLNLGLKQTTYVFLYNTILQHIYFTLLALQLRSNHSFGFEAAALHSNV
jgi:hypothetical protein